MILSEILKKSRENKGLLLREVASAIGVDTSLISKFEKGERKPTREQILRLSNSLDIDERLVITIWLSEKIYSEIQDEEFALDAIEITTKRFKKLTS